MLSWKLDRAGAFICMALVVCLVGALLAAGCGDQEKKVLETPLEEPSEADESPGNGDNEEDGNGDPNTAGEIRGNHPGNYTALALERDGWIYYTHFNFENVRKVRIDGSGAVVLSIDENASAFNMLDGWLYYVCEAGLMKLRADGSGREVLLARPDPYYFHYLNLVDGWFYFAMRQHGMDEVGIFKLPLAGGEPQRLSDDAPYLGLCVAGGWIYYDTAGGSMYRMRTDGSDRTLLGDGYRPILEDGWLYYVEEEASGGQIFRMDPEDGEITAISVDLYTHTFNVLGNWVYYVHQTDDLKLHRFAWEAGGTEVAAEDRVGAVYLYEDTVYYQGHDDWQIYQVIPGTTTGELLP